tara:strand:+ start:795 stop:1343 length:549 start_codon:yes stop_codon:yes gene_type:complete
MIFKLLPFEGAYLINIDKKDDSRGFFARLYCREEFKKQGLNINLVQMNTTLSRKKGTIRGLHFQRPPKAESKIVRCVHGAIWDVIVDLRSNSTTFGNWYGKELTEDNRTMLYVPEGFAHGFQTLSDNVEMLYLHSEFYSSEHEGGLHYNDSDVGIKWPIQVTDLSKRDRLHPALNQLDPITL